MSIATKELETAERELAAFQAQHEQAQARLTSNHQAHQAAEQKHAELQARRSALQARAASGEAVQDGLAAVRSDLHEADDTLEDHRGVVDLSRQHVQHLDGEFEAVRRRHALARAAVLREEAAELRDRLNATFRTAEGLWRELDALLIQATPLDGRQPDWLEQAAAELTTFPLTMYGMPPTLRLPIVGSRRDL
jgi:chromosome segregation ATPase